VRLAVYGDYSYRLDGEEVTAEVPFSLFVRALAPHFERLVVTGRLDPAAGRFPYATDGATYVPLPHYASGADLAQVLKTVPAGARRFWRLLGEVDAAWILGPNPPQAVVFALLTVLRRRVLVLGVRQLLPELTRHRYPERRLVILAADLLERAFRVLGRFAPVVVVGPDLARHYSGSKAIHITYVSLLREQDILPAQHDRRSYDGAELRMLSVGRLDPEKNPLLLADVLARSLALDPRWRLHVCGDGPLLELLRARLAALGIAERATLHGHVPIDGGLLELYRDSHALIHVSQTEGVPQVLLEAFAARLPVVATAVGGVGEFVRGCGLLVRPGDADAAAAALEQIATRPQLRTELVEAAAAQARAHTLEVESERLAEFIKSAAG
jgi:glycosyltransferase involved in cell wall biosynthesis